VIARAVDAVLEASVVGSFTRIGYHARSRLFRWTPLDALRVDGKVVIVTGATSGLGRTAAELIARQGGEVCIVGRDPQRTERARAEIAAASGSVVEAELADLSLLSETAALAARFVKRHDRLDVLVLNAGALIRDYTITAEGNEVTLATHVLSQFQLTGALRPLLEASAPSRVIIVASSSTFVEMSTKGKAGCMMSRTGCFRTSGSLTRAS
jgi:NAD(P)-dependent dehydrogenase (short-subunit alcohol dehydrogenase family)